jgi:hypothetical protein
MRMTIYVCFMALAFVMTVVCMFSNFGHYPGLNNGNVLTIGGGFAAALATLLILILIETLARLVFKRSRDSNQTFEK